MPTGELPRNILMTVDRSMVGTIAPGTRVTAVAIYSTVQVLSCPMHPALRVCMASVHVSACIDTLIAAGVRSSLIAIHSSATVAFCNLHPRSADEHAALQDVLVDVWLVGKGSG